MAFPFRQHLTYAFRRMRRAPLFTTVATAILSLGIGLTSGLFSAVDTLLLRPLPYGDANRLVTIAPGGEGSSVSKATLERLRERQRSLVQLAGYSQWGFMAVESDGPQLLTGAIGTSNLFQTLQVRPLIGRTLEPPDGQPGHAPVVVLGHGYWTRAFSASREILGKTVTLNGAPHTIIGVMPRGFEFPAAGVELWTAAVIDRGDAFDYTNAAYLSIVGRLQATATVESAMGDIRASTQQIRETFGGAYSAKYGDAATVTLLRDAVLGSTKLVLIVLFGAAGFVLLITCANVGNLVLARGAGTSHELAVRTALGAERSALFSQVLIEMVVLGVMAGVIGLGVAAVSVRSIAALLPPNLPGAGTIGVDARVMAFSMIVSIAVGIAFGVIPALRLSSDPRLADRLRGGARGLTGSTAGRRAMDAMLILQFAIALVLSVGAGLMAQTLWRLGHRDPGFDPEGVLALTLIAPSTRTTNDQQISLYQSVEAELQRTYGVQAGSGTPLPFSGSKNTPYLRIDGREVEPSQRPAVDWRRVSPGYFSTLGISLVRGRSFTGADRSDAPKVALINETLARQQFGSIDPIGQRIRTVLDESGEWVTIIGIVGDTKVSTLLSEAPPQMYRPLAQRAGGFTGFVVRGTGARAATAQMVREAAQSVDRNTVITGARPLHQMLSTTYAQRKTLAIVLIAFAALSLILGVTGVFGLAAYRVSQLRREMAIRMALGAPAATVLGGVMLGALRLVAVGLVVGLVASVGVTRLFASQLYGVGAVDLLTLGGATLLLASAATVATLLPARRVTSLNAVEALHES